MTEFLASPLWNLLYLIATGVMLSYAYYSRNAGVQSIAGYLFANYVIATIFGYSQYSAMVLPVFDVIGMIYALWVWRQNPDNTTGLWVANIFSVMLLCHYAGMQTGLPYYIALNLLYLGQVAVITVNGNRYGKEARVDQDTKKRNDPMYRAAIWARNLVGAHE